MNYDFKSNFESNILPLLQTDAIKRSMAKGIKAYLKNERISNEGNTHYKPPTFEKNKLPFDYLGRENMPLEEYLNDLEDRLKREGRLRYESREPKHADYSDKELYNKAYEDWYNVVRELNYEYEYYKQRVLKPFEDEWKRKNYRSYALYGGCFWYNKTFGLELAKAVMPLENWGLIKSDLHLTIANEDNSKVFDILYYDEHDETFGGKNALEDALCPISWEGQHILNHGITKKEDDYNRKKNITHFKSGYGYVRSIEVKHKLGGNKSLFGTTIVPCGFEWDTIGKATHNITKLEAELLYNTLKKSKYKADSEKVKKWIELYETDKEERFYIYETEEQKIIEADEDYDLRDELNALLYTRTELENKLHKHDIAQADEGDKNDILTTEKIIEIKNEIKQLNNRMPFYESEDDDDQEEGETDEELKQYKKDKHLQRRISEKYFIDKYKK